MKIKWTVFVIVLFFLSAGEVLACDLTGRDDEWYGYMEKYNHAVAQSDDEGIIDALKGMIAMCPGHRWQLELGKVYHRVGRLDEAEVVYEQVAKSIAEQGDGDEDLKMQAWESLLEIDKKRLAPTLKKDREDAKLSFEEEKRALIEEHQNKVNGSKFALPNVDVVSQGGKGMKKVMISGIVIGVVGLGLVGGGGGVLYSAKGDFKSSKNNLNNDNFKESYNRYRRKNTIGMVLTVSGALLSVSGIVMSVIGYQGMQADKVQLSMGVDGFGVRF